MPVALKRAYEKPSPEDGYRVLVDRLWPRGIAKDGAKIDEWVKEVAPTDELRKSFHGGELSWGEFRRRYLSDLKRHQDQLRPLAARAQSGRVTLVFSSSNEKHNNAVVVRQYLKMLGAKQ